MPRRSRSRNTSFARSGVNPTSDSEASVSKKFSVMSEPRNSRTVTATRGLPKIEEPRTKIQEPRTKLQNRPVLGIWFLEFGSCLPFSLSSLAYRGKNWSWRDRRSKVYFVSRHGFDSITYFTRKIAYVRHRRLCGASGGGTDSGGRSSSVGVSRLRQLRSSDGDRFAAAPAQARRPHRRPGAISEHAAGAGLPRYQPYALGHARTGDG